MTMVSGLEEQLVGEDVALSVSMMHVWVCKGPAEFWIKMEGRMRAGCPVGPRFAVGKGSSWSSVILGVELVSTLTEREKPCCSIQEVTSHDEWRRTPTLPTEPTSVSYSATGVSMGML